MPLCFRMPGQFFTDDEIRGPYDAVGIPVNIVLTIQARSDPDDIMMLSSVWPGRYRVTDETTRISLKQECQGGWSVTHRFYAPDAERDFYWHLYDNLQTHTLLKNCIWPLDLALRLSEWYGDKCHQLLGLQDNQLFYVHGGKTTGTVPADTTFQPPHDF